MSKENITASIHLPEFPLAIFAFGTGEGSTMKQKNIISQFSEACTDSKIVIEGPTLTGTEVTPNAKQVAHLIEQLLNTADLPEKGSLSINLTGFSRGAITCIRIANQLKRITDECSDKFLKERLQRLELNLFLIDPVTGMGEKRIIESRIIPNNVKNFVSILQIDEMRREFKPQDQSRIIVEDPEKTQVSLLPMYGNHSDSTKIKKNNMSAAPTLIWQILFQFFTQHGASFKNDQIPLITVDKKSAIPTTIIYSSQELLTLFEKQHIERSAYLDSGKKIKVGDSLMLRRTRSMNKHLEFYVKDSDLFTNTLERELFKIVYPSVFNYLFEKNLFDSRYPNHTGLLNTAPIQKELNELRENHPALYERLIQTKRINSDGTLGSSKGYYTLTSLNVIKGIFPQTKTFNEDIAKQQKITQLEQLEQEIIALTFRYEREKSSIRPFFQRSENKRTKMIRQEVLEIMRSPPVNENLKRQNLLDVIEKHARYLKNANSPTGLVHHLETLLNKFNISISELQVPLHRELAAQIVRTSLNLVKETINLIGNLGYIGGGALSIIGIFIRDLGFRLEDKMRYYNNSPAKFMVIAAASLLQGIGTILKTNFGLKLLAQAISHVIKTYRDECIIAIRMGNDSPYQIVPLEEKKLLSVSIDEEIYDLDASTPAVIDTPSSTQFKNHFSEEIEAHKKDHAEKDTEQQRQSPARIKPPK